MPDIRNFFGPKGGPPPARPAPKPAKDDAKARRNSMLLQIPVFQLSSSNVPLEGRMVVDDSDEEEVAEYAFPMHLVQEQEVTV